MRIQSDFIEWSVPGIKGAAVGVAARVWVYLVWQSWRKRERMPTGGGREAGRLWNWIAECLWLETVYPMWVLCWDGSYFL